MLNNIVKNDLQSTKSKKLLKQIGDFLNTEITETTIPPQGMESEVFIIKTKDNNEIVVKHGGDYIIEDILSYDLLEKNHINIPVPKILGNFKFEIENVLLMEKVQFPLLESIPSDQMHRYIPSMINNLKKIHQIKSNKAGYLNNAKDKRSWKQIIISLFDGSKDSLDWSSISKREGLDGELVLKSVESLLKKMISLDYIDKNYSFIHTDFNQRNLFVDPKNDNLTGIIDWGEALFGDPICDFARVRMLIWHFNMGDVVIENYYKLMNYSDYERELDDLYWVSRVVEFLAYYSEDLNDFNVERIKLHQGFLQDYVWDE